MEVSPTADRFVARLRSPLLRRDYAKTFLFRSCCAIGIIAYVDCANVLSISSFGYESWVKYAYFVYIICFYGLICLTTSRLNMTFDGPAIFLIFTALSTSALAFQIVSPVQNNSYAGAFLATLLVSAAAIVDVERYDLDSLRAAQAIQRLLLVLSCLYIFELTVRAFSGLAYFDDVLNQTNHIKSFVFVADICLAILLRNRLMLLLTLLLLAVSEVLRPSSSLIVALILCAPIALAIARRRTGTAAGLTYGIIVFAALAPVALYLSDDLKTLITDAETWTKEDLLQGRSNTFFRLAIQDLAIDRLQETSIAFGAMFSAANSVTLSRKFAWWLQYYPSGLAAIHSDYVSILYQSGVVGYALYNVALILVARFLFTGLALAERRRESSALIGLAICAVLIVVFYSSTNPFLQYYTIAHVAWFIVALGYIHVRCMRRRAMMRPLGGRGADAHPAPVFGAPRRPL